MGVLAIVCAVVVGYAVTFVAQVLSSLVLGPAYRVVAGQDLFKLSRASVVRDAVFCLVTCFFGACVGGLAARSIVMAFGTGTSWVALVLMLLLFIVSGPKRLGPIMGEQIRATGAVVGYITGIVTILVAN